METPDPMILKFLIFIAIAVGAVNEHRCIFVDRPCLSVEIYVLEKRRVEATQCRSSAPVAQLDRATDF